MREIFERYRSARVGVVVVSVACVLALVQAAAARNDLDMHEIFRIPDPPAPAAAAAPTAPAAAARPRVARAHASPAARPLRIALRRMRQDHRLAADHHPSGTRLAKRHVPPPTVAQAALPPSKDALFEPLPQKPAIVSIYADQTLRRNDAVVMADGVHVFRGREGNLHRPEDFVLLTRAASLDWHLRKTLNDFDRNPPDPWRS